MAGIYKENASIVLQNQHVKILLSDMDGAVLGIIDRVTGKDIRSEKTYFFDLLDEGGNSIVPTGVSLEGNLVTVSTSAGAFSVQVDADEDYFTLTLATALPEGSYKCVLGNAKYTYDYVNKENTGACGVALTYWVDPMEFPDSKALVSGGHVFRHLRHEQGKYALIIAPIVKQRDIIKKACLTIDPNEGLVSKIGGAWGRDSRANFGNYLIDFETSKEYIDKTLSFYETLGIDQVDFHQCELNFRQGDFKFERYDSGAEFKKNVTDVLENIGIQTGLHTYSFYIRYDCDGILADPKWQKDLGVLETFTLAKDISADTDFLPTTESTECVTTDYGFQSRTTPFILVGEEIIKFKNAPDGFVVAERGWAGTKAVAHKAGEKIKHIDGYYRVIAPIPGSELFLQIARNTAKAFNEGGFSMIYLDALDGIRMHCAADEIYYYAAMFICELMKHCNKTPLIEYSFFKPAFWAARGRVGAYDYPHRGYKEFFCYHAKDNYNYIDRYSAPTMGWHNFFPFIEQHPGNEHAKYHFADEIHFLGSLAVMHDFSMVHTTTIPEFMEKYAGLRRNVAIYRKYDDLRKAGYFTEETRNKLIGGKWEYHLKEKENGEYVFEEKDFQKKKLYDLTDDDRNSGKFNNPFGQQVPFIRIEALLSTACKGGMELLALDENKDLIDQNLVVDYDGTIDLNEKLAKKVRVLGNGKPGSAIGIRHRLTSVKSSRGYMLYVIDTDFEGWREFTLVETDVSDRVELGFDTINGTVGGGLYPCYRSEMANRIFSQTDILTHGDVSGVRMNSIVAYDPTYEILKNPTVKIGDTQIQFICELMSTDYIEFDGKTAKVIDRYGNEKEIFYESNLVAPAGEFTAQLQSHSLNGNDARAVLTIGFTGNEIANEK